MHNRTLWLGVFIMLLLAGAVLYRFVLPDSPTEHWISVNGEVAEVLPAPSGGQPAQETAAAEAPVAEQTSPQPGMTGTDAQTLIDLNRASAEQLDSLPGIGPAKAQAIIDYRTAYGPFKSIEQLMEVKGIGEKTFEKLKERIVVHAVP